MRSSTTERVDAAGFPVAGELEQRPGVSEGSDPVDGG